MTALLDPPDRRVTTPPTNPFPAARRSAPDALRTAVIPPPRAEAAPDTTAVPTRNGPGRWRAALLGAAVVIAGVATVVGISAPAPLPPLPVPPPVITQLPARCFAGSCAGLDPTAQGCQQDARTIASRIVTAERRGIEIPVGVVELRGSAACGALWTRYALDPAAPVTGVSIESRDGGSASTTVDPVAGHRHLGYGTTPMLAGTVDGARAVVTPAPGAELPSRATAGIGRF
jgi:hypothetical protein